MSEVKVELCTNCGQLKVGNIVHGSVDMRGRINDKFEGWLQIAQRVKCEGCAFVARMQDRIPHVGCPPGSYQPLKR